MVFARLGQRCRYTLPGLSVALVFACLSFIPSLLPRPATFQGAITGIDAAIGYGIGVLGAWVWREFADREPRRASLRSWQILAVVGLVMLLVSLVMGQVWQRQSAELVAIPPESPFAALLIPVVAAILFIALVAVARAARTAYRRLAAVLERHMGARAARATGLLLLTGTTALLFSGVLWNAAMDAA